MTRQTKSFLLITLFFIGLYACQKEATNLLSSDQKSSLDTEAIPTDNITDIQEAAFRMSSYKPLRVRIEEDVSIVGDIDDVIAPPAGTAPATDSCEKLCPTFPGVTECDYLCHLIRLSKNWDIKPGQRFGVKNVQDVCTVETAGSAFSCYQSPIQQFCGYDGREKVFPMTLDKEGNYRIQVSSNSSEKDFDVFVYKKTTSGTQQKTSDDKELVAHSRFSRGLTETIHLTEKGRYHIFIDEYSKGAGCEDGSFKIAISANTNILTKPIKRGNRLIYRFEVLKIPASAQLVKWSFRVKNTEGEVSEPILYAANQSFRFSASQNDYVVSPIYCNTATNEIFEGATTLFRP
jgi:hypothetical protein